MVQSEAGGLPNLPPPVSKVGDTASRHGFVLPPPHLLLVLEGHARQPSRLSSRPKYLTRAPNREEHTIPCYWAKACHSVFPFRDTRLPGRASPWYETTCAPRLCCHRQTSGFTSIPHNPSQGTRRLAHTAFGLMAFQRLAKYDAPSPPQPPS